jgi:hypothetical protein
LRADRPQARRLAGSRVNNSGAVTAGKTASKRAQTLSAALTEIC